jgi:hypothetical protein
MVTGDVERLPVLERVMIIVSLAYLDMFFPVNRLAERFSEGAVVITKTGSSGTTGLSMGNEEIASKGSVGVDRALGDPVESTFRLL